MALHQTVATHGLVHVHGVKAGCIEAGKPHVADDHDLEWIDRIAKTLPECLAARLVADVPLPVEWIGS